MDLRIVGRRALVLGASRGLGAASARLLAAEGATVIAASRSGTADWQDAATGEVTALRLDVSERSGLTQAIQALLGDGPIDILVNNIGGPPPGPVDQVSAEIWDRYFAAMASNIFEITRLVLPSMLGRCWGRIVTIASSGVEQPIRNLGISNTVRSAVAGWSKTLANEVAGRGVTVNLVMPGRIHTDRIHELDAAVAARSGLSVEAVSKASAAAIPAGRYGRPHEFASVVAFLCSERASYVTGSRVRVDGGAIASL